MTLWTRERNVTWAWRAAAVLLSMVAFVCFFAYMAQGMAIGDWIGLGGYEHTIAVAQQRAMWYLFLAIVGHVGAAVTLGFSLPWGREASLLVRFAVRVFLGIAFSLTLNVLVGGAALFVASIWRHSHLQ